ncbi:hypothetical protein HF086_006404 [Spodoptera exigua]|uniref:Uncharacterized protein n=1 Tax=Spodoptera exigua TaxID=7107 RepID=A0A922MX99_SPOEX|nr:hypothetical protein HF086_006404 [Spodoptera exigua]
MKGFFQTFVAQFWIAKNMVLLVYLSVQCENFGATLKNVYNTCVLILKAEQCTDVLLSKQNCLQWILATSVYNILSVCLWQIKNMSLVILQCIVCEKFYISIEDAQATCVQLLEDTKCSKHTRHFCNSIIRSNETFIKMTACGLFCIDATLPLSLAGIISNYVIVLLQFSLSKI